MTNCHHLKIPAADGKMRLTDVGDVEQILRLIQSIPSKKAEPFKLWLSKVGGVIIDEASDPELAIERAIRTYRNLFYLYDLTKSCPSKVEQHIIIGFK